MVDNDDEKKNLHKQETILQRKKNVERKYTKTSLFL
jgi:hypothetical protein